jgi:hypothetical protein
MGFERRSALYARLDAQLRDRTRFFGAAALINAVLAELFDVFPLIRALRSFAFMSELGAALEIANLQYAHEINCAALPRCALDHTLVCAEQRRVQSFVQAHQTRGMRQWEAIRSELNGLLNDRYAVSLGSRYCLRLSRAAREVRGYFGTKLDFAAEPHRIGIGLKLIEHIRQGAK